MMNEELMTQWCTTSFKEKKNVLILKDDFVRIRKSDLDKLTTEVMQLREFLPKVLNRDLFEVLHKAQAAQTSTYAFIIIIIIIIIIVHIHLYSK